MNSYKAKKGIAFSTYSTIEKIISENRLLFQNYSRSKWKTQVQGAL